MKNREDSCVSAREEQARDLIEDFITDWTDATRPHHNGYSPDLSMEDYSLLREHLLKCLLSFNAEPQWPSEDEMERDLFEPIQSAPWMRFIPSEERQSQVSNSRLIARACYRWLRERLSRPERKGEG